MAKRKLEGLAVLRAELDRLDDQILALRDGVVPPTLNLENPSPSCDIDLVAKRAKERKVNYALSNSFGFGGTNASLIFAGPP